MAFSGESLKDMSFAGFFLPKEHDPVLYTDSYFFKYETKRHTVVFSSHVSLKTTDSVPHTRASYSILKLIPMIYHCKRILKAGSFQTNISELKAILCDDTPKLPPGMVGYHIIDLITHKKTRLVKNLSIDTDEFFPELFFNDRERCSCGRNKPNRYYKLILPKTKIQLPAVVQRLILDSLTWSMTVYVPMSVHQKSEREILKVNEKELILHYWSFPTRSVIRVIGHGDHPRQLTRYFGKRLLNNIGNHLGATLKIDTIPDEPIELSVADRSGYFYDPLDSTCCLITNKDVLQTEDFKTSV